jgi:hypothetical protein
MSEPMTLKERLALAKAFAEHFTGLRETLNPEAVAEFTIGERFAVKFAGRVAAWVSLPNAAKRASVKDKDALLAWVRKHMDASSIQTVTEEVVRPATLKALLEEAKKRGGMWHDPENNVLIPIDGIEVGEGRLVPHVELEGDAMDSIGAAWRAGDIDLTPMLALPSAGGDDGA